MSEKSNKPILEAPIKVKGEEQSSTNTSEQLREVSLSWAGKLFFAGAAAYILGKGMEKMKIPVKVRGNPQQMRAVIDAIMSSKKFQQELNRPGATIDSVIQKLQIRNMTKDRFRHLTGRSWPV